MQPIKHEYYYEFPVIEKTSKLGKKLYWQIFAGLVKADMRNDFTQGMRPNELDIPSERILPIYENNSEMNPNLKGFTATATWNDNNTDIFLKAATFITSGKNKAKENRTNVWTQTVKDAISAWNKRNKSNEKKDLLLPMLATGEATPDSDLDEMVEKVFDKYSGQIRVQNKLDGNRGMVRLDPSAEEKIFPYSRSGDMSYVSNIMMDQFKVILSKIYDFGFKKNQVVYLDGEYYLHNYPLQEITGAIRQEFQSEFKDKLMYYIFDVVATENGVIVPDDCKTRLWNIKLLRDFYAKYDLKNIVFMNSIQPRNPTDLKEEYLRKRAQNYEGLIIRVLSRPYESGKSTGLIKLKGSFREEFRIVGFKEASGKHTGLIMFRCRMTEDTIKKAVDYMNSKDIPVTEVDITRPGNIEFWVTPKATEQDRKNMFEQGESYIGKLYTVEFQDWSNALKPIRPKGIEVIE